MTAEERRFRSLWATPKPLLGMIHLLPLPGAPGWRGSMDDVIARARADASALAEAGFDGIVIENYGDAPFVGGRVPPVTVAALTRAALAAAAATGLPFGINVLRNDAEAAVSIAAATAAAFVRVNVHTGSMWTDQGLLHGRAADTMRLRSALSSPVAVLADIHVKHAVPPAGADLATSARDAWQRGLADALIVTGSGTGAATSAHDLDAVRDAVPEAPVLVGSGLTEASARAVLARADGAIVGSALMRNGRAGEAIDPQRARRLVGAARDGR